jgi:hypothetical protein
VALSNVEAKVERTVVTGPQGEYRILALPPGTYNLTVTAKGFAQHRQTALQLLVNTPATANVQLKIGTATEVVTVAGEAPALNMVDASLGNSFDETQVKQIPMEGRNVPDLLSLQAGVAYTGNRPDIDRDQDTRNGSVNGARSDQSNITLDGVDVNDQSSGYAFTSVLPVTLDSVQEFRVTTSNYNADQGQGSGAQVTLVTKSGTNNFHGSFYEYLRNTITSANDYFVKQAELASGQPNKPDKLLSQRSLALELASQPPRKERLRGETGWPQFRICPKFGEGTEVKSSATDDARAIQENAGEVWHSDPHTRMTTAGPSQSRYCRPASGSKPFHPEYNV